MPNKLTELQKRGYLLPETINPSGRVYVCVPVPDDPNHIRAFLGQLDMLSYWWTWDKDALKQGTLAARVWRDVVAQVRQEIDDGASCAPELPESNGCVDYPLSSAFISWYPLSPYTHGGEVPDGWSAAPFTVLDSDAVFTNFIAGDVVASGFAQPTSGDLTLPAIGLDVLGSGTIELHFLTNVLGGMALITVDGDYLHTVTIDLNADVLSIPPESIGNEQIQEITIEGDGEHHVDIRFSPVLDDSATPIRFGGGIRSVVLCGFDDMAIDVRQNDENPCILEKTNDGTEWNPFADLSLCVNTANVPKQWRFSGGHTQVSVDNGVTFYDFPDGQAAQYGQHEPTFEEGVDRACVAAANIVAVLRAQVAEWEKGLEIGAAVTALIGTILSLVVELGTVGAATPFVVTFVAGLYGIGSSGLSAIFTDNVFRELQCEIQTHIGSDGLFDSAEFAALILTLQGKSGIVWTIIVDLFAILGLVAVNNAVNMGGIASCTNDPCDDEICAEWDLKHSPYPFSPANRQFQEVATATQGATFTSEGSKWVQNIGFVDQLPRSNSSNSSYYWGNYIKWITPHQLQLAGIQIDAHIQKPSAPANLHTVEIILYGPTGTQLALAQSAFTNSIGNGPITVNMWLNPFHTSITVQAGSEFLIRCQWNDDTPFGQYDGYCHFEKVTIFGDC